jgi:hypothetical protein
MPAEFDTSVPALAVATNNGYKALVGDHKLSLSFSVLRQEKSSPLDRTTRKLKRLISFLFSDVARTDVRCQGALCS